MNVNTKPIILNGSVLMRTTEIVDVAGLLPLRVSVQQGGSAPAITLDVKAGYLNVIVSGLAPGDNYVGTWTFDIGNRLNMRAIVDATRVSELPSGAIYRVLWTVFDQ